MKAKVLVLSFLTLIIFTNKTFSQGEAAVPFLTFPVSPSQNAMGYTGASLPIDDPYGFLLNPAQLGYTSQQNNFSFMIYPSKVKLWGMEQFQIGGSAFNLGYNFNKVIGFPISIGLAFAKQKLTLDYSNIFQTAGIYQDQDSYNAYSFGVGIDYFIQFNAGITYKNIHSKIVDFSSSFYPPPFFEGNPNTLDFGFLLNIPVLKLIDDELSFQIADKKPLQPYFNISLGYSQLNIGDEIFYLDPAQADPLPRTARLGYGISTGVDIQYVDNPLRFIGIDFTVDAEDLLLNYKTELDSIFPMTRFDGYQSFFGDINIGRNILQLKGDDNVVVHAGIQLILLESFIIKWGHLKGKSDSNGSTNGFEIRSSGLLKFISNQSNNSIIKFISDHFDIRYYNSTYSLDSELETNIKGLALYVHNLDPLF